MKAILKIFSILIGLSPQSAFATNALKLETIAGILEVTIKNKKTCEGTLEGKKVFEFDCEAQYLPESLGLFGSKGKEFDQIVILKESPMGNACNGGPLHIFSFSKNKPTKTLGTIDFCGGKNPIVKSSKSKIEITIPGGPPNRGEGKIPDERWLLKDEKLIKLF